MSRFLRLITRLRIENHETNTKQYPANYKNSEGLAHLSCIVANNCHEWLLLSGLRACCRKYRAAASSRCGSSPANQELTAKAQLASRTVLHTADTIIIMRRRTFIQLALATAVSPRFLQTWTNSYAGYSRPKCLGNFSGKFARTHRG